MAWPTVQLRNVAEQVRRPRVPQPGTSYRQIGVRLWGEGAYQRNTIDGSDTKYPVLYEVRSGDIVVNKIWARNGSVSVITDDLDGSFGSSEFPTYETDKSSLLPDWFYWYSKTDYLWTQCDELSRGTSGQNRLRPDRFLDVRVPLPPPDEQRRIVAQLDCVHGLIEKRRMSIAEVDADLDILLLKAFEKITAGAHRRPTSEVAPLVRRQVTEIDPDGTYPELGVRSFGRGTFHKPAVQGVRHYLAEAVPHQRGRLGLQQHQGMGRSLRGRSRVGPRSVWISPIPHLCPSQGDHDCTLLVVLPSIARRHRKGATGLAWERRSQQNTGSSAIRVYRRARAPCRGTALVQPPLSQGASCTAHT